MLTFDFDDEFELDNMYTVELFVWNSDYDGMGMSSSTLILEETIKNVVAVEPIAMYNEGNGKTVISHNREYIVFIDSDGNEFQRVLTRYPKINYLVQKDGVTKAN
jgi:hypothetical protein